MDENRKKLLALMEELSFPLTEEESLEKVREMSDEDVSELVSLYTDVSNYENALEEYVREEHPEDYKKLVDEREESIKKKDKEKNYELERAREEMDIQLDSQDIKTEREIEEIVKDQESAVDLVEGIQSDIEEAVKNAENPGTSEVTSNGNVGAN